MRRLYHLHTGSSLAAYIRPLDFPHVCLCGAAFIDALPLTSPQIQVIVTCLKASH